MEKSMGEKILDELRKIVNETFKINTNMIQQDTLLFNGGLNLNSIQLLELTVSIEGYYEKEFDADMLTEENFTSIGSLMKLIEEHFL